MFPSAFFLSLSSVWGPLIVVDSLVTSNKAGYDTTINPSTSGIRLEAFAQTKNPIRTNEKTTGKIIVINAIDGSQATSPKTILSYPTVVPSQMSGIQMSTKYTLTTTAGTAGNALTSAWSGAAATQSVNGNTVAGTFGTVRHTWRITHSGRNPSSAFAIGTKVTQGAAVGSLANQLSTSNTVSWTLTADAGMTFDTTTNIVMDNGADTPDEIQGTAISNAVIIKSDVVLYQNKLEELTGAAPAYTALAFVATAHLNVVSGGNTITLAAADIASVATAVVVVHERDVVIEGCGNTDGYGIDSTLAPLNPGFKSTTEGYGIDQICIDTSVTAKGTIDTGMLPVSVFSGAIAANAHCSGVTQPLSPGGCGMTVPVDTQEECDTRACNRFKTGCTRTYEHSVTNGIKCMAPTTTNGTPKVTSVDKLAPIIVASQPKVYKPQTFGTPGVKESWTAGTGIKMVIHGENFPDLHPNPGECTIPANQLSDGRDYNFQTSKMEWSLLYGAQNVKGALSTSPYVTMRSTYKTTKEAFQVR